VGNSVSTAFGPSERVRSKRQRLMPTVLLSAVWLTVLNCEWKADAQVAALEFNQPTNNAVFSNLEEVPILVRGAAMEHDVFAVGELFADGKKIADLSYCCALCPCAAPQVGQETILQIPVARNETTAPSRPFQG